MQAARYRARLAAGLEPDIEDSSAPAVAADSSIAAPDAGTAVDGADVAADAELPAPAARSRMAAEPAVEPAIVHGAGGAAAQWRRPEEESGSPPARSAGHDAASTAAAVAPASAGRQDHRADNGLHPQPEAAEQQQLPERSVPSASESAAAADSECPDLPVGKAELAAAAAAAASNGVTLGQLVAHLRREGGCC